MERKNILISPVGKKALEISEGWSSDERNYDIMLIYYDKEGYEDFIGVSDYLILKRGFKYPLLHQIFIENVDLLSKYDYFFFPDDDVRMTSEDINKLFFFSKIQEISVCQPSLYPKNFTWPITQHNPNTIFRYVSMVEIMCPLFSRDALQKCLPSFVESNSGWGLEVAWYRLLGSKEYMFIIFDLVIATHEGVRGGESKLYDSLTERGIDPQDEYYALEKKYDWRINFYDIVHVYIEQGDGAQGS